MDAHTELGSTQHEQMKKRTVTLLCILWFIGLIAPCIFYLCLCPEGESFYSLAIWSIVLIVHCPVLSIYGAAAACFITEKIYERLFFIIFSCGIIFVGFLLTFMQILNEIYDRVFVRSAGFAGAAALESILIQIIVLLFAWIVKRVRKQISLRRER